jgi:uncharacterized membrane protein YkvA (DUF1232 family)
MARTQPRRRTRSAAHESAEARSDEARVRSGFWDKVRRNARRIPFLEDVVAAYYCAFDPQTPLHAKLILIGALAYFVLPVDAIPDFAVTLGFTDDAAVLYGALRSISNHLTEAHRRLARDKLDELLGKRATRPRLGARRKHPPAEA